MAGVARECPILIGARPAWGVDCLSPMSASTAKAFADAGCVYVGRYIENLTTTERDGIWDAGLGIWCLTEALSGPLSASAGDAHASAVASKAMNLGVPPRVHQTADLEAAQGAPDDVYACMDHFSAGLVHGGWQCALYVGAWPVLSAVQIYDLPNVNFYIHAGSTGLPEPIVGYGMWQIPPLDRVVLGQRVDYSTVGRDGRGRGPTMWWAA